MVGKLRRDLQEHSSAITAASLPTPETRSAVRQEIDNVAATFAMRINDPAPAVTRDRTCNILNQRQTAVDICGYVPIGVPISSIVLL